MSIESRVRDKLVHAERMAGPGSLGPLAEANLTNKELRLGSAQLFDLW